MTVQWVQRIWKSARHATHQDVERLERSWGVRLPEDYKQIAMTHQGMAPEPCVLDLERGNIVVAELLTLSEGEEFQAYSMSDTYKLIRPHVPLGVFPFASTANGDYLCFDYRGGSAPRVVFYFTEASGESALHPVASSFSQLLSKLRG